MTTDGLGEMFEGDSADTCAGKFPLISMGGRAEGLRRPGSEDPHRRERPFLFLLSLVIKIPGGVVVGFRKFAWAPKLKK